MKIAIVGSTLSRARAPYDDPSWTIWAHACTHALRGMPGKRVDAWFELHTPRVRSKPKTWDPHYQDWLKSSDRSPIYLQQARARIPHSLTFPKAESLAWAKAKGLQPEKPYVTSTLVWMLLHAASLGATELGIWGCTLAQKEEYRAQRPCAEYWIGGLRALGIRVTLDRFSPITRSRHVYGFDGPRKDLAVNSPLEPKPIVILPPDVEPPPRVIPPEIQRLIQAQEEMYAQIQ